MKSPIVIAIVLFAHIVYADDDYDIEYNTGISIEYGRSKLNGFHDDPVLVVSEHALIDPITFDLSLLVTGDQGVLKGNRGIGLGAIQAGIRGSLMKIGPLRFSMGIAGGGVLLKEIREDQQDIAIGKIVSGLNEISLNFSRVKFNGKFVITKTYFNNESRKQLFHPISNPGAGMYFAGGFVLVIDK